MNIDNKNKGAPIRKEQSYSNYYDRKVRLMIAACDKGIISKVMLEKYKIVLKISLLNEQYDNLIEFDYKFLPYDPDYDEMLKDLDIEEDKK